LVEITRSLLAGRANLRVRICFDAPQHETVVVGPNLEIEYSGGQGEHRADERIGAHVAWRRPEELDQKWYVVTDDRAVRRQAVKNGARYVPADLFAVLLSDFQCLGKTTAAV
jgi:predicted RNA-binding protein with PIN domain